MNAPSSSGQQSQQAQHMTPLPLDTVPCADKGKPREECKLTHQLHPQVSSPFLLKVPHLLCDLKPDAQKSWPILSIQTVHVQRVVLSLHCYMGEACWALDPMSPRYLCHFVRPLSILAVFGCRRREYGSYLRQELSPKGFQLSPKVPQVQIAVVNGLWWTAGWWRWRGKAVEILNHKRVRQWTWTRARHRMWVRHWMGT